MTTTYFSDTATRATGAALHIKQPRVLVEEMADGSGRWVARIGWDEQARIISPADLETCPPWARQFTDWIYEGFTDHFGSAYRPMGHGAAPVEKLQAEYGEKISDPADRALADRASHEADREQEAADWDQAEREGLMLTAEELENAGLEDLPPSGGGSL